MFFNWPQLYLLGGTDDLLEARARHWPGVVGQLTRLGMFRAGVGRAPHRVHQP